MSSYNWPIVGHQKISNFLQKCLSRKKLAHAYLFSGQEHLGKTLMADSFIASILCADFHKDEKKSNAPLPCGECAFCRQLAKGTHPDIYFLKKEDDKKKISVEQVREMKNFLSLSSFLNSYKIAVIEKAEDLSESAQNALLKVLEEPASKVILILKVADADLLLPTIVSRCQLLKFYPLAENDIFDYLASLGARRDQAKTLAALVHGQIGLAINYFQNPEFFSDYLEEQKDFLALFDGNLAAKMKALNAWFSGSKDNLESTGSLNKALDNLAIILRDILLAKNGLDSLAVNYYFLADLKKISEKYSARAIIDILARIRQIKFYLGYNVNPRLAAENLILNF